MTKAITDIPEWFSGCELNFAENLLKHPNDDKVALITYGEGQTPGYITFGQLKQRVGTIAAALRANGVTRGDRVVGYLPNSSLAVEAMLATASIGAVWSSTSPDFGVTVSFPEAIHAHTCMQGRKVGDWKEDRQTAKFNKNFSLYCTIPYREKPLL